MISVAADSASATRVAVPGSPGAGHPFLSRVIAMPRDALMPAPEQHPEDANNKKQSYDVNDVHHIRVRAGFRESNPLSTRWPPAKEPLK